MYVREYMLINPMRLAMVAHVGAGDVVLTSDKTAELLGTSVHTVKTHIKAIFAKTGAQRQPDLVKLMAGVVSPFG